MSQTGLRVKKESFMTQSIKLTTDQMRLMSLFQNVTGATARDCIEDEKQDRVIFVVNAGSPSHVRQNLVRHPSCSKFVGEVGWDTSILNLKFNCSTSH